VIGVVLWKRFLHHIEETRSKGIAKQGKRSSNSKNRAKKTDIVMQKIGVSNPTERRLISTEYICLAPGQSVYMGAINRLYLVCMSSFGALQVVGSYSRPIVRAHFVIHFPRVSCCTEMTWSSVRCGGCLLFVGAPIVYPSKVKLHSSCHDAI
jgi:hypothetical protein